MSPDFSKKKKVQKPHRVRSRSPVPVDCVDEVIIVEKSAGGDSTGSILLLSERNEDNTGWLSHEDIKPDTVFHKMKSDDIATVHKRNKMLAEQVDSSVIDQWFRDQVNTKTWEKNIASFPEGKVTLSQ